MKKRINNLAAVAIATLATLALPGCAGGGAGSSSAILNDIAGSVMSTLPGLLAGGLTASLAPLVTSVPMPGYGSGSEELAAFNLLNGERSRCGFGLLTQNTQIDTAARNHNSYQIINNTDSHSENKQQFPSGFTGSTGSDRVAATGYTDQGAVADEYAFKTGSTSKSGEGTKGLRGLLAAPYHLSGMMSGYRDVGMSVRSSEVVTPGSKNRSVFFHVNLAYKNAAGQQGIDKGVVSTYPCNGSIGMDRMLRDEVPNPVPGRNLATSPIGTPIYISGRIGSALTVSSASLKEKTSGAGVALRAAIGASNDPNGRYKKHEAYIAPDASLKGDTDYTMNIVGTIDGTNFTKVFSFKTGSGG